MAVESGSSFSVVCCVTAGKSLPVSDLHFSICKPSSVSLRGLLDLSL